MPPLLTAARLGLAGAAWAVATLLWASAAAAAPPGYSGAHLERTKLPRLCGSCHRGHGASRSAMLAAAAERLCYRCHGGSAARAQAVKDGVLARTAQPADVAADFAKPYRHPIERASLHRTRERLPERGAATPRHAACPDCHNPHVAGPSEPRSILGLRARRSPLPGVATEAELCFRCHGPTASRAARAVDVSRQVDLRNASAHAVLAPGRPGRVPSLVLPWTPSSILACTDCHGGDGDAGRRGVHGSSYQHLLRERYATQDGAPESAAAYALCYRCHSRRSILGNESFRYHSRHLLNLGARGPASCRACHTAHGSARNPALIEFDRAVVLPDRYGRTSYQPTGAVGGLCRLSCHGVEHPVARAGDIAPRMPSPRLPLAPGLEVEPMPVRPGLQPPVRPSPLRR
ncbi:MAG TPA: cytochrome c3 family protein [Polyangia bacterium]|jgi:predicted CXXCH cytochrome family protein